MTSYSILVETIHLSGTNFTLQQVICRQVYLLTPIDRATLPHAKRPNHAAHQLKSPGSKHCDRYLKHIAT